MAEFCIHEKHGGVCNLTGNYCNLGPCPNENIEEFASIRHGRWIRRKSCHTQTGFIDRCSVCQKDLVHLGYKTNFCPNCGARMDEEAR